MTDLENLFNTTSTKDVPLQSQGIDDEGQADEERPSNREISPKQNLRITPQTLPQLDTLARPDTLFLHQIPYHMTVKMTQSGILVQGSHHPSLELLAGYFSKWTRTLKNDTRKVRISISFLLIHLIAVCKSLVPFSGFSEFGGENTQISPEFGANRANT